METKTANASKAWSIWVDRLDGQVPPIPIFSAESNLRLSTNFSALKPAMPIAPSVGEGKTQLSGSSVNWPVSHSMGCVTGLNSAFQWLGQTLCPKRCHWQTMVCGGGPAFAGFALHFPVTRVRSGGVTDNFCYSNQLQKSLRNCI